MIDGFRLESRAHEAALRGAGMMLALGTGRRRYPRSGRSFLPLPGELVETVGALEGRLAVGACSGARRYRTNGLNRGSTEGGRMSMVDETKLDEFMGRMVGHMTGGGACFGIWLGDELGLYSALAGHGRSDADELAGAAGCHPRLVREWLDGQAAGRAGRVRRGRGHVLAQPRGSDGAGRRRLAGVRRPGAMNTFGSMFKDMEKITAAFRGDGALAGATTTRASSRGRSGSSGPDTGPTSRASGSRRSTASRPGSERGPRRRRRLRAWRVGGRHGRGVSQLGSPGSTSTRRRSRPPASGPARPGC